MLRANTLLVVAVSTLTATGAAGSQEIDLSGAAVVSPGGSGALERKAVAVLGEEIGRRTGLDLPRSEVWPGGAAPVIAVGVRAALADLHPSLAFLRRVAAPGAEGYTLVLRPEGRPLVVVAGEDPRGVLYGVGRLLRSADWSAGRWSVPSDLSVSTAPAYPVRGHQLGNRDVNNTYDAWSAEQYDRYVRDLALFGANSIEIIPPFIADFPAPRSNRVIGAEEMMLRLVDIVDSYGMDVWVWYANVEEQVDEWIDPGDAAFDDPAFVRRMLESRDRVFAKIRRLDALFVPAGDPGQMSPDALFAWLEKLAPVLQRHHPEARIWVSDQFERSDPSWYEAFFRHVNRKPPWLGGVVLGPWGGTSFPEMRQRVDAEIPIRRYPDITHAMACQYPVLTYDRALALTLGREPPIPRPLAFDRIHDLFDEYAIGSIAYSEGVNDDLNKFVWLDQDWDPERPVVDTLRDYARVFIDPRRAEELAQGFLALEANLGAPLAEHPQVETTLQQWRALEAGASPEVLADFRFQMGLLRAYYDALVKQRLSRGRELEYRAREALEDAPRAGALSALDEAERLLRGGGDEPLAAAYRARCLELADRLRESIGIQLSVERHGAVREDRAAIIDAMDDPLNDAPWLLDRIAAARALPDEAERLRAIGAMLHRTDPGPGGFYDDFGSEASLARVVSPPRDWESDPGTLASIRRAFEYGGRWLDGGRPTPLAWFSHLSSLFDEPLRIRYENLDPEASYRIRVSHGRPRPRPRLEADGRLVYDFGVPEDASVLEYPVPVEATRDGEVVFTWTPSLLSRRTTVAEVLLIRDGAGEP